MPCSRQSSETGTPFSAWRRIDMILASLNFEFLIRILGGHSCRKNSTLEHHYISWDYPSTRWFTVGLRKKGLRSAICAWFNQKRSTFYRSVFKPYNTPSYKNPRILSLKENSSDEIRDPANTLIDVRQKLSGKIPRSAVAPPRLPDRARP